MAQDLTELHCWLLARELQDMVIGFCERPAVKRDRRFCEQFSDAAGSAPRNIAEGFGRFDHREFAHFMKIALGSEQETRTNLLEAFKKKYITAEELSQALTLARRAIGAAVRMKNYLSSTDTPPPKPWRPRDHDSDPSP